MGDSLYILGIIFLIIWAAGFFAFNVGNMIHILLVFAVIAIIIRLIKGRNLFY